MGNGAARTVGGSSEERGTRKDVLGSSVNVVTVRSRLLTWLRPLRFLFCRAAMDATWLSASLGSSSLSSTPSGLWNVVELSGIVFRNEQNPQPPSRVFSVHSARRLSLPHPSHVRRRYRSRYSPQQGLPARVPPRPPAHHPRRSVSQETAASTS